ncbi:hypothetical protein BDR05DRAFT_899263 [Suillus weaverae]|nr:hypothetical protein BDR05DRAFT_899263 [Suillus weaverae]
MIADPSHNFQFTSDPLNHEMIPQGFMGMFLLVYHVPLLSYTSSNSADRR